MIGGAAAGPTVERESPSVIPREERVAESPYEIPRVAPLPQDDGESEAAGDRLTARIVHPGDPLARPLLEDLEREYDARYGIEVFGEPASVELNRYPEAGFTAPDGAFLLLLNDAAVPVSGGAFMRYDDRTAEFKRIWTRPDLRGRGLAKRVLVALEEQAARQGYERVYLTTGPRQPEAVALYLGAGYTPLFDRSLPAERVGIHPFEKTLGAAGPSRPAPLPSSAARTALPTDPAKDSRS